MKMVTSSNWVLGCIKHFCRAARKGERGAGGGRRPRRADKRPRAGGRQVASTQWVAQHAAGSRRRAARGRRSMAGRGRRAAGGERRRAGSGQRMAGGKRRPQTPPKRHRSVYIKFGNFAYTLLIVTPGIRLLPQLTVWRVASSTLTSTFLCVCTV